jgi:hypothetical protein
VSKIEDSEEWKCFECEPNQLREQRLLFFSILAFWQKVDEKVKKKVEAKKAKEKAKNRSDCLTKTYQLASQCNLISKNFVTKNAENWAKNPSKLLFFWYKIIFVKFYITKLSGIHPLENRIKILFSWAWMGLKNL